MRPSKKALACARRYLYAHAVYCQTDCHDSMVAMDTECAVFEQIGPRGASLVDYILEHLADEIPKAKAEAMDGEPWETPQVCAFLEGRA